MDPRAHKLRKAGIGLSLVAFVLAFLLVPTGRPSTYGRTTDPMYEFVWAVGRGRMIDMGRVWFQTLLIGGIAVACFWFASRSNDA